MNRGIFTYLNISIVILVVVFVFLYLFTGVFGDTRIGITLRSNLQVQSGLISHWTFDGKDFDSTLSEEVRDRIGTNHGDVFFGDEGAGSGT